MPVVGGRNARLSRNIRLIAACCSGTGTTSLLSPTRQPNGRAGSLTSAMRSRCGHAQLG